VIMLAVLPRNKLYECLSHVRYFI